VLKITSEQLREGETYPESYDVADLVIPIPNFVPGSHFGLQGAIADAQSTQGYGLAGGGFTAPMAVMASKDGTGGSGMINPQMLAQIPGAPNGALGPSAPGMPIGTGPGGLGGGTQADFDALIELITTTIEPDSWEENGGTGSIAEFETNLSIVVSATQEVHEQIVDLLEQLRRLQDLQVTIEVRFITLSDSFFERIGIDFDFFIEDSANPLRFVGPNLAGGLAQRDQRQNPSATVGLQPTNPPSFTADLDIPFTQDSFLAATPQFGGFDAAGAANFGFAILSDIEAFFLIQAAQGDTRSNVLQAPKVTLFNGQTAFVADTAQRPFVISVIPVVGDFAAAQQPVVVVLSEGTSMSVQAVVSPDRRYVRLTVVPFFSQIGDVDTFTFDGASSTTDSSSSSVDDDDDTVINSSEENTIMRQGTTVQLPTFAFVTVTTTVSVPDGGTVLLGGIKRLAEGRNEFGVPMLSKIPYVNRLFRNVGIGRETESLMMMVTPRIIIQEEEEERLLGASSE
jgi:general secretion pathway protein D